MLVNISPDQWFPTGTQHVGVLTFHQVSDTLSGTMHVSVNIPPVQWYPDRNTAC